MISILALFWPGFHSELDKARRLLFDSLWLLPQCIKETIDKICLALIFLQICLHVPLEFSGGVKIELLRKMNGL